MTAAAVQPGVLRRASRWRTRVCVVAITWESRDRVRVPALCIHSYGYNSLVRIPQESIVSITAHVYDLCDRPYTYHRPMYLHTRAG